MIEVSESWKNSRSPSSLGVRLGVGGKGATEGTSDSCLSSKQ